MHQHLASANLSDAGQQHYLKSSFGMANKRAPQQQQPAAGRGSSGNGRSAAGSGSSTPNSLCGFTPVSPVAPAGGADVIAQAWEAVDPHDNSPSAAAQHYRSSAQQQQQQQHYPAIPGADSSAHARPAQQQQAATEPVHAAAAVQFAAGVSLTTGGRQQQQQQQSGAAQHSSGHAAHQQQQQQQSWSDAAGAQGAFGVQLMAGGGSLMAAMGGWVVNQAISAAAETATAAIAAAAAPPPPRTHAAEPPSKHSRQSSSAAHASSTTPAAVATGSSGRGCSTEAPAQPTSSSTGSWWKRFSGRPEPPAAEPVNKGSGLKSLKAAAAKRHGLRKKASVAAATAAAGGGWGRGSSDDGEGLAGLGEASGPEDARSDGSAEYSQLLSEMDDELQDAVAAGAAAAVSSGGRGSAAGRAGRRSSGNAGAAAGAAAFMAGGTAFEEVNLDEEEEEDFMGGQGGGGWLAAVGLARGSSSSTAAPAVRADSSSGGGYLLVDHDTGLNLVHRARVLRGLLLWRSPGASAKALGFGIYIIMLVSNIPRALHYMQVTTVLPGVALLYLTYNLAKPWAIRLYCSFISTTSDAARLQARLHAAEETAARAVVWFVARAAVEAGSWALAVAALAHRALRARRFTTSCWTFVALWLLLLVSKLRLINQTLLAMVAYAGCFCVPWMYQQFRTAIDKVVYDTLHFLTLLLVNAERWAYAVAILAAALTWQVLEPAEPGSGASLVVRCTASGIAGIAVLLWRVLVSE